jgi:phosphate starvation-inducible PhoH-like protein
MSISNHNEGGESHVVPCKDKVYVSVSTDLTTLLQQMLKSREKRKLRRAESAQKVERTFHQGMDVLPFYSKTDHQEDLWTSLNKNTVTIAIGPAGVGKTLVALWWGLTEISRGNLEKIYYVRSDVGCAHQRSRGALPGTMEEKMAPLVGPVYDNLTVMTRSQGAANYLVEKKVVDPILLEDLRGRSFSDCLIIFDEAQNATPEQVKTTLSRVAERSKVIVTGDTRQIDLEAFKTDNGLLDCYHRLANISGVGRVRFDRSDIVRNGIIADILEAYES